MLLCVSGDYVGPMLELSENFWTIFAAVLLANLVTLMLAGSLIYHSRTSRDPDGRRDATVLVVGSTVLACFLGLASLYLIST